MQKHALGFVVDVEMGQILGYFRSIHTHSLFVPYHRHFPTVSSLWGQQAVGNLQPAIQNTHAARLSAMTGINIFLLERQVSCQVEY
jgi:hypothetical protein